MREIRLGNIYGEDRGTGFAGNVWDQNTISPTLTTMQGGGREPMVMDVKKLRFIDKGTGEHQSNIVYDPNGISPCICSSIGVKEPPVMTLESQIVAMRGRNPENPTSRQVGLPTEQMLEPNAEGIANTITTVQKDNLVLETKKIKVKQATKQGFVEVEIGGVVDLDYPTSETRRGRAIENGRICPTLTTENIPSVIELADESFYNFLYEIDGSIYCIRIRKLTPRECWRLMGFTDDDFDKAQKVNSNTQLYKQAGNSIVVPVLERIFKQMLEEE